MCKMKAKTKREKKKDKWKTIAWKRNTREKFKQQLK